MYKIEFIKLYPWYLFCKWKSLFNLFNGDNLGNIFSSFKDSLELIQRKIPKML